VGPARSCARPSRTSFRSIAASPSIPTAKVLVTLGVSGRVSKLVLDAFVNAGDRVVLFDPTFAAVRPGRLKQTACLHSLAAHVDGRRPHTFSTPNTLAGALRGARLMVISSPAKPDRRRRSGSRRPRTHRLVGRAARRAALQRHGLRALQLRTRATPSLLGQGAGGAAALLTAGSVSKSHALAALRTGLAGRSSASASAVCRDRGSAGSAGAKRSVSKLALTAPATARCQLRGNPGRVCRQATLCRGTATLARPRPPFGPAGAFFPLAAGARAWDEWASLRRAAVPQQTACRSGRAMPSGPAAFDFVRLSYAVEPGRFREGPDATGRVSTRIARKLDPHSHRHARLEPFRTSSLDSSFRTLHEPL